MSKYKTGDKVVMEITKGKTLLGTDYYLFNDGFGIRQGLVELNAEPLTTYTEQARAEGHSEAWELARKIVSDIYHGGYNLDELKEIFDSPCYSEIFDLGYTKAAAKVAQWEKAKKEIKVGDVLEDIYDSNVKCTVTNLYTNNMAYLVFDDGTAGMHELDNFKKTGRHIDIDSFLKQIGEE